MDGQSDFTKELSRLINRYGIDSELGAPDFLIAEHVTDLLRSHRAMRASVERHYPSSSITSHQESALFPDGEED